MVPMRIRIRARTHNAYKGPLVPQFETLPGDPRPTSNTTDMPATLVSQIHERRREIAGNASGPPAIPLSCEGLRSRLSKLSKISPDSKFCPIQCELWPMATQSGQIRQCARPRGRGLRRPNTRLPETLSGHLGCASARTRSAGVRTNI